MKKLAIIGAGQLGSRHLQGLAQINFEASIEVVDPNKTSLEIAKQRFKECPDNQNIISASYFQTLSSLSYDVDIAIIATGSKFRFQVLKNL